VVDSVNVVTLDWRRFGDFSAVGQLTKKIFSADTELNVHSIQCFDDGIYCSLFQVMPDWSLISCFDAKIGHDALINYVRRIDPSVLYVRLSPHKGVLELACKLTVRFPHLRLIVHYMDKPYFNGMTVSAAVYLKALYRFLVRRADSVYVIHESSRFWFVEQFGREPKILGNYIVGESAPKLKTSDLLTRPISIAYFGSIDRKMNADAITAFCLAVSNKSWVRLSIWTNSGIWGRVKEVCDTSGNISIADSNLPDADFKLRLAEPDFLLLPYNFDCASQEFLNHSFSNKFIDYLEVGGVILCLGSRGIPTVQACRTTGVALVFESELDLRTAFATRDDFIERLASLDLESYLQRIQPLKSLHAKRVGDFFEDIKSLVQASSSTAFLPATKLPSSASLDDGALKSQLAFLIRRKFFDLQNGERQSLSATLMANLIKARGYSGFDYEI
jgi:hypothetical protein